jgi:hypothetical protein
MMLQQLLVHQHQIQLQQLLQSLLHLAVPQKLNRSLL